MSQVSFRTNGPNSFGSLYWFNGTTAGALKFWANKSKNGADVCDAYPEGARVNLSVRYDERPIFDVSNYVLPQWPQFKRDVLAFAKQDRQFCRNRKPRPFHVVG